MQGRDQAGPQTRPRAACGRRAGLARPRAPSFFACDLVAVAEAPERAHAHLGSLLSQPRLQLGQGHVRHLGQRRVDEVGMGLGSTREPVPALRLRSGVPSRPAQGLPADGAGRAHAKPGRGLAAGQALVDRGQNTSAKVEGQRLGHARLASLASPCPESDRPHFGNSNRLYQREHRSNARHHCP